MTNLCIINHTVENSNERKRTYIAIYRDRTELKALIKKSGFNRRDIAAEMGLSPGCLNMKLSGYQRFSPEQEALLLKLCEVSNDN